MRKARFNEYPLIAALKCEADRTIKEVCREAAIAEVSDYHWKAI